MKIALNAHVAAPVQTVWQVITDLDEVQGAAFRARIGLEQRMPGGDLLWDVQVGVKGRHLNAEVRVTEMVEPRLIAVEAVMGARPGGRDLIATGIMQLSAVAEDWTLMSAEMQVAANSLTGRMILQPLQLAKRQIRRKAQVKFDEMAVGIETRAREIATT